jgi:hypothetical protein
MLTKRETHDTVIQCMHTSGAGCHLLHLQRRKGAPDIQLVCQSIDLDTKVR